MLLFCILAKYSVHQDHRVGRVLSFFSCRWNWDSPNPSTARVCPPPPWYRGEVHTRWRERGWERGHTLWYSFYVTDGNIIYLRDASRFLISCVIQHYYFFFPGSRILIFTHRGSRIPGPKTATKERGEKKFCCHNFYCSHKFHKIANYFSFELLKKKVWANFQRIIELFNQNCQ
jgi:hypothetical protein